MSSLAPEEHQGSKVWYAIETKSIVVLDPQGTMGTTQLNKCRKVKTETMEYQASVKSQGEMERLKAGCG